jgi:hypothetical protein
MLQILIGIFLALHGVVHGIYTGQSLRIFELQPAMVWPENSWLLSKFFNQAAIRWIGGVTLATAAMLFIVGGATRVFNQAWFRPATLATCIFSSLIYLLFWDGTLQHLDNQGGIGILINTAIAAALLLNIPAIDL